MIIILFGAPGVGKGTQATILAEKLGIAHLSTGDAFRSAIKNGTAVGKLAKGFVDEGRLVPDEIVARIVEEAMELPEFVNGCILDGFPRTRTQAEMLGKMLEAQQQKIACVVNITVDDDRIISRLLQRGRADDDERIIRDRLEIYRNETAPLLDFYNGTERLVSVDGIGSVNEVNERILRAIAA